MGGSKQKTTSNQKTTTEIPAEIRERGTAITTGAMNEYFDPAQKYQPYNFSDYAQVGKDSTGQLNDYHDRSGAAINESQTLYRPYIQRADDTASSGAFANQADMADGPNYNSSTVQQFMNPFTQGVIDRGLGDIGRAMNTARLDNQSRAAMAGAFGGARHGVVDAESQRTFADTAQRFVGDRLSEGFGQAVNQYNTDFSQGLQATAQNNQAKQQNWNTAQSLSQIYANLGQQTQNQGLEGAKASLDFGNVLTAQEQAEKDAAFQRGYMDRREYPMETYERLAAINAMQPHNRTSTTVGSGTSKSSGGWLGPALGAAGNIAMAFSDERTKEDVAAADPEETLAAFAQVEPKTYRYRPEFLTAFPELTQPGLRTGFLAQDMERAFGSKVGKTVGGLKTVDLSEVVGRLTTAVYGLERRTRSLKPRRAA